MSKCAHLTLGLPSSEGSTPSTNDFKNRAAVQLPAARPPIYNSPCVKTDQTDERNLADVHCKDPHLSW